MAQSRAGAWQRPFIIPHGDRETCARARATPRRPTLITPHGDRELRQAAHALRAVHLLITPHGDREPAEALPEQARGVVLITPHGDREHGRLHGAQIQSVDSLPLMGIGNSTSNAPNRSKAWTHYPSWGSGTRLRTLRTARKHGLITPHGDREPDGQTLGSHPIFRSLPLMGIGNAGAGRRQRYRLHLITPHGDRELERPTRVVQALEPHYPSWGSGTGVDSALKRGTDNSLPLMGIGNTPQDATLDNMALFLSLPLMGIGNPTLRSCAAATSRSHYPSWGSGTRRRTPPSTTWRSSSHYPSWGLGTRHYGPAPRRPQDLITPHGDREPGHGGDREPPS